jgi:hypothetical protein
VVAGLILSVVAVTTAQATDVFDDVEDDRFYADPVEWAAANAITTGKSPTMFAPLDAVTRGESVTFLKRYDDNITQPALADLVGLFASDEDYTVTTVTSSVPADLGLLATVTVPSGRTGVIWAQYSAESACYDGDGLGDWCKVDILIDGVVIDAADQAFDSTDDSTETFESWESHVQTRVTSELPAGTYAITATSASSDGSSTFRLDDMVLTAEVKLTS